MRLGRTLAWLPTFGALAFSGAVARAGGYDTPMLYSARHMGMGGTAIGYVRDPSALFHNPAGLAHIQRFAALGDLSLLLARAHGSPARGAEDIDSERTVAPMFLLGAGLRLTDWLTAGLGLYPIASAGAKYEYEFAGAQVENRTKLVFFEGSPALAVNLPGRVRLGAGYRITYVDLQRFQGIAQSPFLDFGLTGWNFQGFRVGAQWTPMNWLQLGASYRHKTETKVKNKEGVALAMTFTDVETTFVLPSKLGVGARADLGDFGLAVDGEYLWNSQNDEHPLIGTAPATPVSGPMRIAVPNVFDWKDAITLRGGLEYRLLPAPRTDHQQLALRAGYIYDGKTTNERYPSAFGTPPGPTQVVTAGLGWNAGSWQANVAYGYRFGEGEVTAADLMAPGRRNCAFCSVAGMDPYRLRIHGIYADVSFTVD